MFIFKVLKECCLRSTEGIMIPLYDYYYIVMDTLKSIKHIELGITLIHHESYNNWYQQIMLFFPSFFLLLQLSPAIIGSNSLTKHLCILVPIPFWKSLGEGLG